MAKFFYRGNALWVRGTIDKTRYQLSCGRKTTDLGFNVWFKRANADKMLEELVAKENETSFGNIEKFDLETFGMRILRATNQRRGYQSQLDYENLFKTKIVPFFADPKNKRQYILKDISRLSSLDCIDLLSNLKAQLSDDRVKRCRNIFSTILDFAMECKYLSGNPFLGKIVSNCIEFNTSPVSNKTYTTREVKMLLDNSEGWFNLFLEVLFKTGMRVGEAKGIQWGDINFETGQLEAKRSITHGVITDGDTATKKHKRTIYLYPSLLEKLKSFYSIRESNQWVFTNEEGSFVGENHALLSQLKKLCAKTNVEYKTLKPTRRTYSSIMKFSGVTVEKIQEDIGHSKGSSVTSKHYIDRSVLELSQEQKIALKQEELFLSMVG